ncbi:MAG: sensor histidine kinase [Oscillospiraceae bacterium]|nr:sensor histidine kinase [Oscillospiraceae bacterium]
MNILKKIEETFDKYKIKTKMMFIYIIVLIPVFIGSMYLITEIRTIMTENDISNASSNADRLRLRMSDTIAISENISEMICTNEEITEFLSKGYEKKSEIYTFYAENDVIKNYLKVFPQLKNIRIYIERAGFAYNSHYREATEQIKEKKWYYEAVRTAKSSWQVITDPSDKKQYLSYVRAIHGKHGQPLGVAVIEISPDWISEFIYDNAYRVVLSVNNGVVFYSNMENIGMGTVITSSGTDMGTANQREVIETGFMGINALTVMETFNQGASDSVFQIFLINPGGKLYEQTNVLTSFYSGYIILLFVISLVVVILFTNVFASRVKQLSDRMHTVAKGDFKAKLELNGNDEIALLNSDLSVMVDSMQLLIKDAYQSKLQTEVFKFNQMEAEFKALASQINPHFLYNTLETIRMKAYFNNDKETADLIKKLGKFMRRCLEAKVGSVTLKSELDFTNSYLELQGARFGDRISYNIDSRVDDDYPILPLIIQPVVENAFVHGIESSKENGRIEVTIYYCGEYVYIDVSDNGQGITAERMKQLEDKLAKNDTSSGKSIGLTNVNKRVKMYHGNEYGLSINSEEGNGTNVRIMLPREPESDEERQERLDKGIIKSKYKLK